MSTVPTDLSNWRTEPHSAWSFVNVEKLVPIQIIKFPDREPTALHSKEQSLSGFRLQLKDKPLDIESFLEGTDTDGYIVMSQGNIVYEHYSHNNDRSSKHIMMSMTKSIVGLLVGHLKEQDKLDMDAPVTRYLPEMKGTSYDSVTVRHLLDMRSGVQYDDSCHEYRAVYLWDPLSDDEQPSDALEFLKNFHHPNNGSGGPFAYQSVNTDLLGLVIERATGEKFADQVSELIWKPMGAESDAFITVDRKGNPRTAGGMAATLRDIARVGQALVDGTVAPKGWLEDMMHGGDTQAYAGSLFAKVSATLSTNMAYRSCWITDDDEKIHVALGIHGQSLMVDVANNIVVVKTSSQSQAFDVEKAVMTFKAFREIQRVLLKS